MWDLIFYLYLKHVNSNDKNAQVFSKQEAVKVFELTQQQLAFYSTMLIRNFFTYSMANMQIKLSTKHLLGLYRLHKFEPIMKKAGVQKYFKEWIQNQMMPFNVKNSKAIPHNCQYIYIDFKEGQEQENNQVEEEVELKKNKSKSKQKEKGNKKKEVQVEKKVQKKQVNSEAKVMINVLELTKQLENRILIKQQLLKPEQISKEEKRLQAIQKFRKMKLQEYIFQKFNKQSLMTYNFIRKYPFIEEKQLLNKTMLPVVELRKCLSNLIEQGFINFYPQTSKSMLYKTLNEEKAQEKYRDHIAKSILNLYHYLNKPDQKDEQKMKIILKSLDHLDDILMIFMA